MWSILYSFYSLYPDKTQEKLSDIITGTLGCVSPLKDGDLVEVEIEDIDTLKNQNMVNIVLNQHDTVMVQAGYCLHRATFKSTGIQAIRLKPLNIVFLRRQKLPDRIAYFCLFDHLNGCLQVISFSYI